MGDSDSLGHLLLGSLLDRLASSDPVPGGGSAAAIAGAMGAALVAMVAELTIGRPDYAEHEAALIELRAAAHDRRLSLLSLAEEDAAAYEAVVRARRMPRESEAERATRAAAVRVAMIGAAEVPLRTARVAAEVLALADRIASIGNRVAVSDAGVAAQLARAALRGAVLNVRINLPYLPADEPMRTAAPAELDRLERESEAREQSALDVVDARMQPQ
jgi:formiminotetrahydrofolate cyclodeaminase